jgi:hypothetical protein
VSADETPPGRLEDLDTEFPFDPADPTASIRAAETTAEDRRVLAVGNAVRDLVAAGVLDAVTEAAVKDYVLRKKLLAPATFGSIVREARPRPPKAAAKALGKKEDDDESAAHAAFMAFGGELTGAEILDEIDRFVGRYLVLPNDHCRHAMTLWAAHTHVVEAFYVTPRLIIDSPEPESGKTRVLEHWRCSAAVRR